MSVPTMGTVLYEIVRLFVRLFHRTGDSICALLYVSLNLKPDRSSNHMDIERNLLFPSHFLTQFYSDLLGLIAKNQGVPKCKH